MEIPYGPRSLHAELQSGLDRLVTERRRTRRIRRPDRGRTDRR